MLVAKAITSLFTHREWVIAGLSCVALALLKVDGLSFALLFLTSAIQWWCFRVGRHREGVWIQLLTLLLLKISMASLSWPQGHFPFGFSFYSLSVISLQIQAMRNRPVSMNFGEFFAFLSYAPKFFAGPIERADRFVAELRRQHHLSMPVVRASIALVAWGALKKFCVADPLWPVVETNLLRNESRDVVLFLLGLYALALHFFAEFSGYVDMARGISRLIGIRLAKNFRAPFRATNPQDFWQRWHISLTTWLRDYVHYPTFFRTKSISMSVFAVFLFMGLWHGVESHYIALGLYWSILVLAHDRLRPWLLSFRGLPAGARKLWALTSIALMFQFSAFAFFLLYSSEWWEILGRVGPSSAWTVFHSQTISRLLFFCVPFLLVGIPRVPRWAKNVLLLYFVFLVFFFQEESAGKIEFMYFQF